MTKLPYYKQETDYTCGAASMRMALEFCGIKKSEKEIAKLLGTKKSSGTRNRAFPKVAEKFRLNYASMRNASISDLKKFQKNGYAVIIGYFYAPEKIGHYSVLKKIDNQHIYFYDPYLGDKHKYPLSYFKKIWKNNPKHDNEKRWFFAVKKSDPAKK